MEDMNMIPMCSVCEIELEYTQFVFDYCDADNAYFRSCGYCPECGREYHWFDRYDFVGIIELECAGERED